MGTITVTCDPEVTVSSQLNGPNPHGIQTVEESNCYYGQVQQGSFKQIVQPFGVLTPRITGATGVTSVSGTGLYPNSNLTVTAKYTWNSDNVAGTTDGTIHALSPSLADGSFSFIVEAQNPFANHTPGTLSVTVTDSQGNLAWGNITTGGFPQISATGGTPRAFW